jgi:hypothetical protein
VGPALAVYNGRLYMAWRGLGDPGIWFSSFDGTNWAPQQNIAGVATDVDPGAGIGEAPPPSPGPTPLPDLKTWGPASITFADGTALGGHCTVVVNNRGNWTFSGHMHDSGFDSYDYSLGVVIMTPSGIGYTLRHGGHTQGTSANPLGSPNRNDDWTDSGNNPSIRDNWAQVAHPKAAFAWRIVAQDNLAGVISDAVQQALQDLIRQGVQAGVVALIALL